MNFIVHREPVGGGGGLHFLCYYGWWMVPLFSAPEVSSAVGGGR